MDLDLLGADTDAVLAQLQAQDARDVRTTKAKLVAAAVGAIVGAAVGYKIVNSKIGILSGLCAGGFVAQTAVGLYLNEHKDVV